MKNKEKTKTMKISMPQFAHILALVAGSTMAHPSENGQAPVQPVRQGPTAAAQRVFKHWTKERISAAIPRDIVFNGGDDARRHLRIDSEDDGRRRLASAVDKPYEDDTKVVMTAAGRIYFEMGGTGYVCSGTVATDGTTTDETQGRSIILTAGHCVYDDVVKAFASNVLFIPKQDDGGNDGTDLDCSNDQFGCWAPSFGVVEDCWAAASFPDNIRCDWAYYVVNDFGAHLGPETATATESLEVAVGSLLVDFRDYTRTSSPCSKDIGVLMGYSYSQDPDFRYCDVKVVSGDDGWEFPDCGLTPGSSGGPGMFGCNLGDGPMTTVVSWGSTRGKARMGGPYLHNGLASCGYNYAKSADMTEASTNRGVVIESDGAEGCVPKQSGNSGGDGGDGGDGDGLQCIPSGAYCSSGTECPPVTTNPQVGDCCSCDIYVGCRGGRQSLCNGYWQ